MNHDDHTTYYAKTHPCPSCGKQNDAATAAPGQGNQVPRPGDLSLCFGCARPMVFTSTDGDVREPTAEEWITIEADPEINYYRAAIVTFRANGGHL